MAVEPSTIVWMEHHPGYTYRFRLHTLGGRIGCTTLHQSVARYIKMPIHRPGLTVFIATYQTEVRAILDTAETPEEAITAIATLARLAPTR